MRRVRIFVSSPFDVEFERQRIDRVAQRLNGVFADIVRFDTIRWEKGFYSAHASFQPQIEKTEDCEIVIAIFWSRIGSPLPEDFARMPGGEAYPSGSAFEVLTAIEARRKGDHPDVYVFRKSEPPIHRIDQDDELVEAKAQLKALDAFFARWFRNDKGEFLGAYHDFKTTDQFEDMVERLLRDWVDAHIDHDHTVPWPIETMGSPFRALLPFDAKHAAVYFGRDRKVTRAIEQLKRIAQDERSAPSGPASIAFLLIVGESGSGKSSLMRAGLAPRLTSPGAVANVDLWRTAIIKVGDEANPFLALARALFVAGKLEDDAGGFGAALPELREGRAPTPELLAPLLASGTDGKRAVLEAMVRAAQGEKARGGFEQRQRINLLLLVDQLENIFAPHVPDDVRTSFARVLFQLSKTRRIWVVATLRSDLYPRMLTPGNFIALKDAGASYDLAAPGESELSEIVQRSASATGLVYEVNPQTGERLDERILKDAQGEHGLPLLEYTLDRLFQNRETIDGKAQLTFAAYHAMGGLDGAIDQTATAALAKLGAKEVAELPRLLRWLAVPVQEGRSGAAPHGSYTVRMVALKDVAGSDATRRLIDALIDARIIVATGAVHGDASDGNALIGIAHQRVFESWKEARRIVEENKEFFRIRGEVEAARQRWQAQSRDPALLLPKGVPLAEGESIVARYGDELTTDISDYVAASSRRAQRNQRILAGVAAGFAALFFVAAGAGIFAYVAKQEAETSYGAAKQTVDSLITTIAQGLGNLSGISVKTVDTVLAIVDDTIGRLESASRGDSELVRSRASMLFQFAKVYQKVEDHAGAMKAANESYALRASLVHYDPTRSSPQFASAPAQLRYELSESIELLGDLAREDSNVEQARSLFDTTLSLRRALAKETPTNTGFALGISYAYVRIGDLDMQADPSSGLRSYEAALSNTAQTFLRAADDVAVQRELSWDFNKVGDVRYVQGTGMQRQGTAASAGAALGEALDAYDNSLCIRERLDSHEQNDTQLKRDITYTLDRIATTEIGLDKRDDAAQSYFRSLEMRRLLSQNDPDNALYLSDVALSLEHVGDMLLRQSNAATDPPILAGVDNNELALAFYTAAEGIRAQALRKAPDDTAEQRALQAIRKKIARTSADFNDEAPVDGYGDALWSGRIGAVEARYSADAPVAGASDACWTQVRKAVDEIAKPDETAMRRPSSLNASAN